MPTKKPKRRVKPLARTYEVKAEISNATLAKAKSALSLQIYRRQVKLGEIQIGRDSPFCHPPPRAFTSSTLAFMRRS